MSGSVGKAEPRRIVMRCPNWLGDVVMITPALRELRRRYPDAKIVAQLPEPLLPLLGGLGFCDELWPLQSRTGGFSGWRRDVARLREGRFDLGLVVPESVSSALLMRLGGVAHVAGFARDPLRRGLLHEVLEAPLAWGRRRLVSKERYALHLVGEVVGNFAEPAAADLRTQLHVSSAEHARLEAALASLGVDAAELRRIRPVVLAPGASFGEAKCWPATSYAELGDRLAARGLGVVLLGGPGEHARIEAVRKAMDSSPVVLDGVLDVGALKALLEGARAVVANDAGTRHVAAAFGVPGVIFFGPTSVAKTPDNLLCIEVLETEHACRPCYQRTCPIDHRCLRSIQVKDAEAAMDRILGASQAQNPLAEDTRRVASGMPLR